MTWLKEKWWAVLILLILVYGVIRLFFLPNTDKELRKQFEKERQQYEQQDALSQKEISRLRKDSIEMVKEFNKQLKADSVEDRKDSLEWTELKKDYNELFRNYRKKNYTDHQFDSIHDAILKRAGVR